MNDEDRRSVSRVSDEATSQQPTHSYNFLLRMSRVLGSIATKYTQMSDTQSITNHEIKVPSAEKILGNTIQRAKGTKSSTIEQTQRKDLKKLVARSHETLMSANTVFPMTIFPDTVTVDRTKITITRRDFFWSSDVMSIRIEDVLNVSASVGPLFGSLTIASRVMSTIDHFRINHFWRKDAIRLKHVIQGYVIAQHNRIDTAHLNKKELIETLIELGLDSNK